MPYAVVLGVADEWAERFEELLSVYSTFAGMWYSGVMDRLMVSPIPL